MNALSQYLISIGLKEEIIILVLMLPLAATIIAAARQVVGLKGFGLYTPLIISFAFLATGLEYGTIIFLLVLLTGTLTRLALKKLRLLYLPRMALVLTSVSLATLLLFMASAWTNHLTFVAGSIFSLLIMITLVEKFVAAQIESGAKTAIWLTLETFFLAVACYFLIDWSWLQTLIINYPVWFMASIIIINFALGKWTGLRLLEYIRFKQVIKNVELSQKK